MDWLAWALGYIAGFSALVGHLLAEQRYNKKQNKEKV